ncbi:P-loop containing nucleoside triphosphate hydrolase protein [Polychaeton citri CBS 116435]|uniref:P-loop containing nucleoside triphosphate hydrolase protein n=1 Tax=Polychaeton citri CBS 116435 TaxID=1314669 RepID=A0A9P4Q301_9PEZI|nr:P-loop containing nucleoside triphosphate hydrolase protein [Polychaeton citri CBS 116435]
MEERLDDETARTTSPGTAISPDADNVRSTSATPNPPPSNGCSDSVPNAAASSNNSTDPDAADAMSNLTSHGRELIKTIQKIETMGIDTTLPSLPKFVVIGDQSAGKSSIIEAACEISLPRSHGTCTRCPFHIMTSASKANDITTWSCKVSLHKRYAYDSRSRKPQRSLLQHWDPQDLEVIDFATTTSRDALKDILRRAQLAVLNPQLNAMNFVTGDVNYEESGVGFSPNVIMVEIEGSRLPELSFYDLPGAINAVARKEDQYLVSVVEQLIKHYLQDRKALVLLACGADQDIETSTAFRFLRQEDATGRCMGVLTKPDLVVPSAAKARTIHAMMSGERFELGDSWFITKQMSQEELDLEEGLGRQEGGVSHADARRREDEFFTAWLKEAWCAKLSDFKDRCGITQLQAAISQKLTTHIIEELPEIERRVQQRLETVEGYLAGLPSPPMYPSIMVHNLINEIQSNIRNSIVGYSEQNEFRQQYRTMFTQARAAMRDAKPQVDVKTPGYQAFQSIVDDDDDDDDGDEPMQTPTPAQVRATKRRKRADGTPTPAPFTPSPTKVNKHPATTTFGLGEVRERYERGNMSGLQGQLNPKVTEALALQTLKIIPKMINALLAGVKKLGSSMIRNAIDRALDSRHDTKMYSEASKCVQMFWDRLALKQQTDVQHLLQCEMRKAVTYQVGQRAREHDELLAQRQLQRVNEYFDGLDLKGQRVPASEGRIAKLQDVKWVKEHLGNDDFAQEIFAMSLVLDYYNVATGRILDTVAVLLDNGLLQHLHRETLGKLLEGLRAHDNDSCAELLADDPQREQERLRLMCEKEKLLQALQELQSLPARTSGAKVE